LQHRVERAKGLLQSRLSLLEVATATGFAGEKQLTRYLPFIRRPQVVYLEPLRRDEPPVLAYLAIE
jgi:hypothetical protein